MCILLNENATKTDMTERFLISNTPFAISCSVSNNCLYSHPSNIKRHEAKCRSKTITTYVHNKVGHTDSICDLLVKFGYLNKMESLTDYHVLVYFPTFFDKSNNEVELCTSINCS